MNSASSKLDEISSAGRIDEEHFGLGYTGKSTGGTIVFVKGSTSEVKNDEVPKASVVTLARTPAVIISRRVGVATSSITTIASPGKKKEKRWIPICHYCNRRGHIRPQCYQYLADLRRVGKKMPHSRRSTKQVWMEKSNLRCNMACTSLKAMEEINVKEKIKQVADMQGELDLCGDVVSDVPALVVDTPSVRVNDSTKKHEERGRIPLFFIFLCLFLAKRGRMC